MLFQVLLSRRYDATAAAATIPRLLPGPVAGHVLLISEGQHGAAPAPAVTDTARQIGEELADALAGEADHFPDLAQGFAFRTERFDEYETFGLLGRHHFCVALFGD